MRGDRVFLGLRGPVIGLHAGIQGDGRVAQPAATGCASSTSTGSARPAARGDDLLLLAGPVEDIDGIQSVHRLPGAVGAGPDAALSGDAGPRVRRDALERVLRLPIREGCDHAEGLALLEDGEGGRELLVAYDSPGPDRLEGDAIEVDCHDL